MVPTIIDQIGAREAYVAAETIDQHLALHQHIRDLFPGVPRLEHRDLLASIADTLRREADQHDPDYVAVPAHLLSLIRERFAHLLLEAEKHWMDDRIRRELDALTVLVGDLPEHTA